ncbi:MAG: hypothetical protein AB1673_03240 [Actinomycetota bacterium]|jgi:hypothetical protein
MDDEDAATPDPDAPDEILLGLTSLIDQAKDPAGSPTARIQALIASKAYMEGLTRRLVNEAREQGVTWEDLAVIFGTSPVNAKARYGDYNDYD